MAAGVSIDNTTTRSNSRARDERLQGEGVIDRASHTRYCATTRKKLLEPSLAGAFVRDWLNVFDVISADDTALIDAVHEHGLSFRDAMIWATARQAGCSAVLSEDMQDGQRPGVVEFVDPFSPDAVSRVVDLLDA